MKRTTIVVSTIFLLLSTLTLTGFVVVKSETEEVSFIIKMSVTYLTMESKTGLSLKGTARSAYS